MFLFPPIRRQVVVKLGNEITPLVLLPFNFVYEYYMLVNYTTLTSTYKKNKDEDILKEELLGLLKPVLYPQTFKKISQHNAITIHVIVEEVINIISKEYDAFMSDKYVKMFLESNISRKEDDPYADIFYDEEEDEKLSNQHLFIFDMIFELINSLNLPSDMWEMLDFRMAKYFIRKIEQYKAKEHLELINTLESIVSASNTIKPNKAIEIMRSLKRPYLDVLNIRKPAKRFKSLKEEREYYQQKMKEKGVTSDQVLGLKAARERHEKQKENENGNIHTSKKEEKQNEKDIQSS